MESPDRTVAYPVGGSIHSVLGFMECEQRCVSVEVGDGLCVAAVAPPGLVLLKANAYLERRPALTHDLEDIDFIARTYEGGFDATTVFERAAEVLQEEHITYEHVGAYLLGRDLAGGGFADAVLAPLLVVLAELKDPMSRSVDDVRGRARLRPDHDRATIVLRYAAMSLGLGL